MYREGKVTEVDARAHRVRCEMLDRDGIQSPWLAVLVRSTRDDLDYGMPTAGQIVAILLDEREETGVVLGAVYSDHDPPPAESTATARGMVLRDGAVLEYDVDAHRLRIELPSGGIAELCGAADFVALAGLVHGELDALDAELSAIQTTLGTGVAATGGPVTFATPYVKAYTRGDVASAQVKSA